MSTRTRNATRQRIVTRIREAGLIFLLNGNSWGSLTKWLRWQHIFIKQNMLSGSTPCFVKQLTSLIQKPWWSQSRLSEFNKINANRMNYSPISSSFIMRKKSCRKHSVSRTICNQLDCNAIFVHLTQEHRRNGRFRKNQKSWLENSRVQCSLCHRMYGFCTFRSRPYRRFSSPPCWTGEWWTGFFLAFSPCHFLRCDIFR